MNFKLNKSSRNQSIKQSCTQPCQRHGCDLGDYKQYFSSPLSNYKSPNRNRSWEWGERDGSWRQQSQRLEWALASQKLGSRVWLPLIILFTPHQRKWHLLSVPPVSSAVIYDLGRVLGTNSWEPRKMNAYVLATEGGVNHNEGCMGHGHLCWHWFLEPCYPRRRDGTYVWLCDHLAHMAWFSEKPAGEWTGGVRWDQEKQRMSDSFIQGLPFCPTCIPSIPARAVMRV